MIIWAQFTYAPERDFQPFVTSRTRVSEGPWEGGWQNNYELRQKIHLDLSLHSESKMTFLISELYFYRHNIVIPFVQQIRDRYFFVILTWWHSIMISFDETFVLQAYSIFYIPLSCTTNVMFTFGLSLSDVSRSGHFRVKYWHCMVNVPYTLYPVRIK